MIIKIRKSFLCCWLSRNGEVICHYKPYCWYSEIFFFLTENISCLMVASVVGPVGRQWAGSDASLDAWTPGSSWVDHGPGTLRGLIVQALQDQNMKTVDFLCVCVCGLWDAWTAGAAVLKLQSTCYHELCGG